MRDLKIVTSGSSGDLLGPFRRHVATKYRVEPHDAVLIAGVSTLIQRLDEARRAIERDGLFYTSEKGIQRPHPAAAVERATLIAIGKLLRQLGLSDEKPGKPGRRGRLP